MKLPTIATVICPMLSFSKSEMLNELVRTNQLIEDLLGYQPDLFRPPYGVQGPGLKMALDELDMTSILMSTHGLDWEVNDPELIANTVLESIEPGSIILLHDGHGDVHGPQRSGQQSRERASNHYYYRVSQSSGVPLRDRGRVNSSAAVTNVTER